MNSPLPLPGQQQYNSIGALVKILPGVAHRVTDRLSVGATIGLAVSHAELEGPFFLQTGILAGAPTLFDLQATGVAPSWSAGLQYQLSGRTTLGLVYTSETRFRLDGDVKITAFGLPAPLGPGPLQSNFDAEVDLVWPRSVGAGFAHRLCNGNRVSVDVLWYNWSHAFDRLDMKLTNGTNPLLNAVVGSTVRDSLPLNWDGVWLACRHVDELNMGEVLKLGKPEIGFNVFLRARLIGRVIR